MSETTLPVATLPPPDGRLGSIAIGSLDAGERCGAARVSPSRAVLGRAVPEPRQRRAVEHALTGDSHVIGPTGPEHPTPGWWDGNGRPGRADRHRRVVCRRDQRARWLPRAPPGRVRSPPTGGRGGRRFPKITIRDQVAAEKWRWPTCSASSELAAVLGGSMGGMRALEWAVSHPERVAAALILAVGARATADQIGTQTTQIAAITRDPDWQGGDYYGTGRAPTRRPGHRAPDRAPHLPDGLRTRSPLRELARRAARTRGTAAGTPCRATSSTRPTSWSPGSTRHVRAALRGHEPPRRRPRSRRHRRGAGRDHRCPSIVGGVDSDRLYPMRAAGDLADDIPGCDGLRVLTRGTATTGSSPRPPPSRNCSPRRCNWPRRTLTPRRTNRLGPLVGSERVDRGGEPHDRDPDRPQRAHVERLVPHREQSDALGRHDQPEDRRE